MRGGCRGLIKHKIWAEIDLLALEHNYKTIKEYIEKNSPECTVMCIVKADCYGHGSELCIPALYELGVRDFGVSCIEEALDVRRYAPDARILILGYTPKENIKELIDAKITQSVYSYEYAKQLSDFAVECYGKDAVLDCHIKIDTGMNRIGFSAFSEDCASDIVKTVELPCIRLVGAFTHFACADDTKSERADMSVGQYDAFMSVIDAVSESGVSFETLHTCNSAAAVRYPEYNLDMIRLGLMLYGHSPFSEEYKLDLRPVMRFVCTVTYVHKIKKGQSVSYGATFVAERDMTLATVSAGYADGFLRSYGTGGMYVRGKLAPVVGRVCMDQCMLDVTDIEGVEIGDEAEIFDKEGRNISSLSEAAGTINYELLCSVSKRVNRIAKKNV